MKLPEKKQRWVLHEDTLPQPAGAGVTRRVLAYTDGLMCVENTFEKGAVGALHHHPHTQITYVVSGAFEFTVDGVTRTVHKGDTILKYCSPREGTGLLSQYRHSSLPVRQRRKSDRSQPPRMPYTNAHWDQCYWSGDRPS